jgi:hypothetical protein
VAAPVDEFDRRFRQRVARGTRHQHFARLGEAHDPRRGVDVQSADLFAAGLTRTGVHAGAEAQSKWADRQLDGRRAANRGVHRVKDREKTVTGGVDFASTTALQRTSHGGPIAGQQCVPALVPQAQHVLCRADNVGKQEAEGGGRHVARFAARPTHCP